MLQIEGLMADMSEKEKKQLFAGSVPIGLNRNQVVIGEQNFNDNLYLVRSNTLLRTIQLNNNNM
jgi:hypothetical protein